MKHIYTLLFCFISVTTCFSADTATYTLTDAIAKKMVKAEIKGADVMQPNSGNTYGKCMLLKLINSTNTVFNVKLEVGQQLVPADSTVQTMIVTENRTFLMKARGQIKEYINAMCMQMFDAPPTKDKSFSVGGLSTGYLMGVAQLINEKKYFDSTGQYAVWGVSDNLDVSYVNGKDTTERGILQRYVCKATGQPLPEYKDGKLVTKMTETVEWGSSKVQKATLTVYDKKGKVVRQVLKDEQMTIGYHSYGIVLSNAELPAGEYKIVLYLDGKLESTRKVMLPKL